MKHARHLESLGVVEALPFTACVVDPTGRITLTNAAWRRFAVENGGDPERCGVGTSYFAACEPDAHAVAAGIASVLRGGPEYVTQYPCHSSTEERHFEMHVTPIESKEDRRALIVHVDVTARVKASEKLAREHQRLLAAERQARVGTWELHHPTDVLWWSDEIYRIFEVEPDRFSVSYGAFLAAVHPEDRAAVHAAFVESLATRAPYRLVHRLLLADGGTKYVEERCETDFDATGRPLVSRGTAQDVTDRVEGERALRESEERLSLSLEAAKQHTVDWDIASDRVWLSPSFITFLGITEEGSAFTGAWVHERTHPADRAAAEASMMRILRGESDLSDAEFRIRREGHDYVWVRGVVKVAARAPGGAPRRLIGTITCISERKLRDLELLAHTQRHDVAETLAGLGVWEGDLGSGRQVWSPQYYEMLGCDRDTPASHDLFLSRIHPNDMDGYWRSYCRLTEQGELIHTFRIVRANGHVRHLRGLARLIRDEYAKPQSIVGATLDVTETVAREAALRDALRAKELLVREIHHRVKNNLQTITSLLHFHSARVPEEARAVFADLDLRVRAMQLLQDLLHRSGDAETRVSDYLGALLTELSSQLPPRARIEAAFDRTAGLVLNASVLLPLGMLVVELVTNAAKHAFPARGGVVHVEAAAITGTLTLTVTDDGVGLPAVVWARAQPGFGLKLVRALARQLQGELDLFHPPMGGTMIRVRMSLKPETHT